MLKKTDNTALQLRNMKKQLAFALHYKLETWINVLWEWSDFIPKKSQRKKDVE